MKIKRDTRTLLNRTQVDRVRWSLWTVLKSAQMEYYVYILSWKLRQLFILHSYLCIYFGRFILGIVFVVDWAERGLISKVPKLFSQRNQNTVRLVIFHTHLRFSNWIDLSYVSFNKNIVKSKRQGDVDYSEYQKIVIFTDV